VAEVKLVQYVAQLLRIIDVNSVQGIARAVLEIVQNDSHHVRSELQQEVNPTTASLQTVQFVAKGRVGDYSLSRQKMLQLERFNEC
jgi:hypothetical protein